MKSLRKKFLLIFLLITFSFQKCDKGCAKCDLQNKVCLYCDLIDKFTYDNGSCQKVDYPFCQKYTFDGYCTECAQDYYLNNGTCIKVNNENKINKCKVYKNINSCLMCEADHYLVDGKCENIVSPMEGCDVYKPGNWQQCELCKRGYMKTRDLKSCIKSPQFDFCYFFNSIVCQKCKNGFFLNKNYYLKSTTYNDAGRQKISEILSINKSFLVRSCEPIVATNCFKLKSNDECEKCEDNYFLYEKLCYKYPEDSIINCQEYNLGKTCTKCVDNYYRNSPTNCESVATKPIENCLNYDPTSSTIKCIRCNNDYILETEGKCIMRSKLIDSCKTPTSDKNECEECKEGFQLTGDKKKCLAIIPDCQEYEFSNEFSSNLTCKFCKNKSSFSSKEDKCISGKKENCELYKNDDECYQCSNEFYIPGDKCIKHLMIDKCETYDRISANKCTKCSNETYLFNRANKCLKTVDIQSCEIFSKINKCSKCLNNFYLVDTPNDKTKENYCAEIPAEENCVQKVDNKCILCRRNYVISEGKCVSNHDSLQENCAAHNADGTTTRENFQCQYCKQFAYPINLQNTFVCTNSNNLDKNFLIPNCTKYFWNINLLVYKCSLCREGFFLDGDKCSITCSNEDVVYLQKITKVKISSTDLFYNKYYISGSNVCGPPPNNTNPGCSKYAPDIFKQANTFDIVDYVCVQCSNGYFPTIEKEASTNFDTSDISRGIEGHLAVYPGLKCITLTPESIISSQKQADNLVSFCAYYYKLNVSGTDIYGCFRCKFGYTGIILPFNPSNIHSAFGYIDICTPMNDVNDADTPDAVDGKCDLSVRYQGYTSMRNEVLWNKTPLEAFITCHKCQIINGQEFRPFIFVYNGSAEYYSSSYWMGDIRTSNRMSKRYNNMNTHLGINKYAISPQSSNPYYNGSGGRMQRCLIPSFSTFVSSSSYFNILGYGSSARPFDCALYMVNVSSDRFAAYYSYFEIDLHSDNNVRNSNIHCAACMPGFNPSLVRNVRENSESYDYYRPYYIYNCVAIQYCEPGGTWVNHCEKCQQGYMYEYDTSLHKINYNKCVPFGSSVLSHQKKNCRAGISGGICKECDKGYELYTRDGTNYFCEKVIPGFCNDQDTVFVDAFDANYSFVDLRYLLSVRRHGVGCNSCREGYIALEQMTEEYICSNSGILTQSISITNYTQSYCKNYSMDSSSKKLFCKVCDTGYVPIIDGSCQSKIQFSLDNCLLAVKVSDSVYSCEKCEEGFIFLNTRCIKGSIEKCLQYDFNKNSISQVCSQCEDGYYSTNDKCIKGNIKNCKDYTNEKSCQNCDYGYQLLILQNNIPYCVLIPTDLECKTFISEDFQSKNLNCAECKTGFFPDSESEFTKSYCLPFGSIENCLYYDLKEQISASTFGCIQCTLNFYWDIEKKECKPRTKIDPNCYKIDKNLDKCIICKAGYYLAEDGLNCNKNPSGVPGCRSYSKMTTCSQCKENMYLKDNICILIQESIRIPFCKYYENELKCIECDSTHFLNNNICKDSIAKNCDVVKNQTACATCIQNYGFKTDENQKIQVDCVPFTDVNCKDTLNIYPFECKICKENYYPLKGVCVKRTQLLIPDCITYDGEDSCQICSPGKVRSIDKKTCETSVYYDEFIDNNCESTINNTPADCVVCDPGYYFSDDNKCIPCKEKKPENGCMFCDNLDNKICLFCITGYYMNEKGECIKLETDPVKQPDVVVDNSLKDYIISYGGFLLLNLICF